MADGGAGAHPVDEEVDVEGNGGGGIPKGQRGLEERSGLEREEM